MKQQNAPYKGPVSLRPLPFDEAVTDLLKVKPMKSCAPLEILDKAVNRLERKQQPKSKRKDEDEK